MTLFSKEYPASIKVLSKSEWEKFRKGYEHLVEDVLSDPAEEEIQQLIAQKKQTLYDKLGYINSLSMGSAFEIMTDTYQVDLHDLWPVYETGGMSKDLSWIRNQLSHGRVIAPEKASAIIGAGGHLRWTLERLILGFLGWPVEKSNVSKNFLSQNMACYCDLKEDRTDFKQLL